MKKIIEVLRIFIVSLEFLYVVCLICFAYYFPLFFERLGKVLLANSEMMKWLPVAIISSCGISFKLAWRLTKPLSESNRILYDWPDYWKLKYRRNIALVFSGLMALLATYLWIFSSNFTPFMLGFLFLISIGISTIVISCLVLASFTLTEIIEQ